MSTFGWIVSVLAGIGIIFATVSVIWVKGIRPVARFITYSEKMYPMLIELTEIFKDSPNAFKVLEAIAEQFRTNDGSTLKDAIDRLEKASRENAAASKLASEAAENVRIRVEADRLLVENDRKQRQELVLAIDRLSVKVTDTQAVTQEMKENASIVASNLAASHKRASESDNSEAGAAADAAVKLE